MSLRSLTPRILRSCWAPRSSPDLACRSVEETAAAQWHRRSSANPVNKRNASGHRHDQAARMSSWTGPLLPPVEAMTRVRWVCGSETPSRSQLCQRIRLTRHRSVECTTVSLDAGGLRTRAWRDTGRKGSSRESGRYRLQRGGVRRSNSLVSRSEHWIGGRRTGSRRRVRSHLAGVAPSLAARRNVRRWLDGRSVSADSEGFQPTLLPVRAIRSTTRWSRRGPGSARPQYDTWRSMDVQIAPSRGSPVASILGPLRWRSIPHRHHDRRTVWPPRHLQGAGLRSRRAESCTARRGGGRTRASGVAGRTPEAEAIHWVSGEQIVTVSDMTVPLAIVGRGAITAIGLSAASTCAAIRAHVSGYSESNLFHESFLSRPALGLNRIPHARVPAPRLHREDSEFEHLIGLAAHAIGECLQECSGEPAETALVLGVRDMQRDHPDLVHRSHDWIRSIEAALKCRFHTVSQVMASGHTAVFEVCTSPRAFWWRIVSPVCRLRRRLLFECLRPRTIREDISCSARRLQRGSFLERPAACVALRALRQRQDDLVVVLGVGTAQEEPAVTVLSDGHPTGRGLARALDATIADAQMPERLLNLRISDLNRDSYRTDESFLAAVRFYKTYRSHLEIWHPADCVGEIGAASGAMSLVLGAYAFTAGYAPEGVAMCESSSDTGRRAGCVVGYAQALGSR